jgi:ubiquinone/menaquinone biosynthesis C-methylase UbiE
MAHGSYLHQHRLGRFDRADDYDRHAGRLARRLYEAVAAEVAGAGLPDGANVLDIGTGPGRLPLMVAALRPGLRIEGLDVEPNMVERARRNAAEAGLADRVTFRTGDVARLEAPDDSVDLVVSTISQHHWEDPAAGFRELARVVRPGGRVWIYDFRLAARRAERAARAAFPGREPARVSIPGSGFWGLLVTRLTIDPA